ncbi:MAG: ABC transporter permease [Dehalococcoidia bacterium]
MAEPAANVLAQDATVPGSWSQPRGRGMIAQTLRLARRKPLGAIGAFIILLLVVVGLFAPWIAPYGPNESTNEFFMSPSLAHPFGTDHLGRDMLSRVIYGARVSLEVGLLAVLVGTGIGAVIGLVSGYFGGWVDLVSQRFVDILSALPGILLALTIAAALGASLRNVILAIGISIIPTAARIVRGSALSTKEYLFVEAATVIGAGPLRVMWTHIRPNVMAPIIVIASIQLGAAILSEASLSYLGLGVPLNVPSWGSMLSGSALRYMVKAPWMAFFPGLALTLVVLGINLFGDALRDVLDPRLRRGRG